jgi:hypothetical protein
MITQERVRELFRYEPETGRILNRFDRGTNAKANEEAGWEWTNYRFNSIKYRCIYVDGNTYRVHRLIWLYVYGYFPEETIDHIDGDGLNNRIDNLRLASMLEQAQNRKMRSNNTSGVRGVFWNKATNSWRARIKNEGIEYHLGMFNELEEAKNARLQAERRLYTDGFVHRG